MIMCNKSVTPCGSPKDDDLKLINEYTRREYSADELYTFSVVLCDNEIDRDFEQFSVNTLEKLSEMFIGKTGISDHNPKSSNQLARIYSCKTEKVEGKKNCVGEDYVRVVAKAYIPRSEKSKEFIQAIDSGIKKEVSVGCAVKKRTCSVCGVDLNEHVCNHVKGEYYKNQLCYQILSEPSDAYEWSFVAVPAQREAGVIKSFYKTKGENMENIIKNLSSGGPVCLSSGEAQQLYDNIKKLKEEAILGKTYKQELVNRVVKLCTIAEPGMAQAMITAAEKLDINELKAFCEHYSKKADEKLIPSPQLYSGRDKKKSRDNSKYSI